MAMTDEQIERYSRHIILKEVGAKGQKKLLKGKVLIIGAGGLGAPAAMYLAAAGVGTIGIVDADEVDLSNLQRQIIHSTADIGKAKVKSAKETMNAMNPDVEVKTYRMFVDASNIRELIREYDFIIDGTDNFPAKFLINDACVLEKKPFSHAGIIRFKGQLMTYVPGEGPCYRCVFKNPPPKDAVPTCKQAGVIGAMGGVIGSLQAMEAIKYLIGVGDLLTGYLLTFDALTMAFHNQQISFAESDLPLIYRTERALQLICDKLQQVELKRVPRVENLLYFMQNTRKRLEPQLKSNTENAAQTTVRTLIYAPETQASSTPEAVVPPLPGLPEMKVEVRSLTENPPQASMIKQGSTVREFIAGIACSVAVASALWWWQVYPVQQQLLQVNDTAQGAATVWMASPELENYERRLQQLLDTSPVQPLETGMQMMRVADSRWPESLQQQQASTQWNEALKTRAQSSPQLRGWLQTRQDLHAFADLVMQREKEGLTLSYIKNVIWQAERGLGQETPVESLLTQYQDARAQKQNTDALEKQINERLEGVLSRWLLLKNNVMPEAATGTTAEK